MNSVAKFFYTGFEMRDVSDECKGKGQVSHHPFVHTCRTCLIQNEECIRRDIFVATADCETGNKGAFEMIRKSVEEGNVDHDISLLTVLLECIHLRKSFKSSFSNWWLKLNNIHPSTPILDLDKFTDNNLLGMYPSLISVSVAKFEWLLFLSWDSK